MDTGWKLNVEVTLPACPHCGSSKTKFCYYNNYSLTQPRYFCKGCRRYWTKVGSLRNVPISGGCRKSRRGKSTRASSTCGVFSSSSGAMLLESGSSYPGPGVSTNIDLAAVYANFLDHKQQPEPRVQTPKLLYDGIPSFDYITAGLCQESGGGILSDKSLEVHAGDDNARYFCGLDSFDQKHQSTDNHLTISMNGLMNNSSSLSL